MTDKTFLDEIFRTHPLRPLPAVPKLMENMSGLIADMKQRIMRLCANDAANYGWALLSTDRIDQILSTAMYLDLFDRAPEAFFDPESKKEARRYGQSIRRFLMANRLNPDKVAPLAGVDDAAVFLMGARQLIEE